MFKKLIVGIYVLICLNTFTYAHYVSHSLSSTTISVKQGTTHAIFERGAGLHGEPGQPELPFSSFTFLVPPDADLKTVSVSIEGLREEVLAGTFDVKAALPPMPSNRNDIVWPKQRNIVDGKDSDIYSANTFFPQERIYRIYTGKLHGYKLVEVILAPFTYNPVTKKLKKIVGGELKVDFSETRNTPAFPYGIPERYSNRVKQLATNYDKIVPLYPSSKKANNSRGPKYVIITTSSIVSNSNFLDTFIKIKQGRGFDVQVATDSDWGGGSGTTASDNIRDWLKSNYQSLNIEYVLLIGNPLYNSGDVPMRNFQPKSDEDGETDYYYSELTGNCDADNDGTIGEYNDFSSGDPDKYHELAVGRISVYDNDISTLDHILEKITIYEQEDEISAEWRKNVLLPMEPSDDNTPGNHLGEAIKDDILTPASYGYYRIYDFTSPGDPEKTPCDKTNVLQAWQDNNFGLCVWWTHGSTTSAADIMDATNAAKLNDDHPTFTCQVSCTNAKPTSSDNLAYSLLKNGAIVTMAGTDLTWYMPGQTDFANSTTNSGMSYSYAKYLVEEKLYAGDAYNKVMETLSPSGSNWWTNYVVFVIYGDPSLGLNTFGTTTDPFIKVTSPNGTEECEQNSTHDITWSDNIDGNVTIDLFKGGTLKETLAGSTESDGLFEWAISGDYEKGTDYKIKITSVDSTALNDESDGNFSITGEYIILCPYFQPFDTLDSGTTTLPRNWEQLGVDDLDWLVWAGKTPSKEPDQGAATGPDGDHTSSSGNYLYVESSGSNNPDKKADYITPKFNFKSLGNPELTFWYHMFSDNSGADEMGDLYLDINVDGTWHNDVIHLTGDHGDEWFSETVDLSSYMGERVVFQFRAITGSGWASDICIDDFEIDGVSGISDFNKNLFTTPDLKFFGSRIYFQVPEGAAKNPVRISLYNSQGKLVKTLVNESFNPGNHSVYINKTDYKGQKLATGIYLCRLEIRNFTKVINIIITK